MEPEFEPLACRRAAFASLAPAARTGFRGEESDILASSEPSDCSAAARALKKASRTEETLSSRSLLELLLSAAPRKCGYEKTVGGVGG